MLNGKALSELLSSNSDGRLCKRWFLMTRNGTLLAYTETTNIQDLRKQAAMATLSWQEQQVITANNLKDAETGPQRSRTPGPLHTLTLETESSNFIIRKIQSSLLLVLEGGVPPRPSTFEHRITPESAEGGETPPQNADGEPALASAGSSTANSIRSTAASGLLSLQRKKLDAMAAALVENFEKTGFKMPEEGNARLF